MAVVADVAVHQADVLPQLGAGCQQFVHQGLLLCPAAFQLGQALALGSQEVLAVDLAVANGNADRLFPGDDLQLGFQGLDAPAAIVHLGRHGVQADGDAGASGIQQADGFVRQLARGNVAMGQFDRGLQRFVEDLHLMVLFHGRGHAAHHQQRLVFRRFGYLHHLEAPGQGRVFLDVLLVLGPGGGGHGAQGATGQGRLEQVGRVAGAGGATGAHQGVGFVDEQDDRLGRGLDVLDDLAQALFELALHAGAGLQQADVEAAQFNVLERRRHVAGDDAQGETFHHRGLAHPGFTGEDRVVLPSAHEDVHQLADLFVAADDGVELAAAGLFGEVDGEALEGFLLAQGAGGHGAAGFAGHRTGTEAVAGAQGVFRRVADVFVKALAQGLDLDLVELA